MLENFGEIEFPADNRATCAVVSAIPGQIPIITIAGPTVSEVWEKSILATAKYGLPIPTQYDRPGDPLSRDCTVILVIEDPLAEPRIHRGFPAGIEDLEIYRLEVVDGIKDHLICPEEGKWLYTYHKRLFGFGPGQVNQIEKACAILAKAPHSRRALGVTWDPSTDYSHDDPPCLQQIWIRMVQVNGEWILQTNFLWRSRDGFKAAFMNLFALTSLIEKMASLISEMMGGVPIKIGRLVDTSWSYHLYGSYFEQFKGFCELLKKRKFAERTWTMEYAKVMLEAGAARITAQLAAEKALKVSVSTGF